MYYIYVKYIQNTNMSNSLYINKGTEKHGRSDNEISSSLQLQQTMVNQRIVTKLAFTHPSIHPLISYRSYIAPLQDNLLRDASKRCMRSL